jgi:Zn-dependent protease
LAFLTSIPAHVRFLPEQEYTSLFKVPVADLILWFVVFLFSLSFHEAAHAWTSDWFGDYTGRYMGRVTLNPLAHIDPIGTILLPLMGFMSGDFVMFGWAKPVQTNPLLWRNKTKANIIVSAAGPVSNFTLAAVAFVTLKLLLVTGVMVEPHLISYFNVVEPAAGQAAVMEPIAKLLSVMLLLNLTLGLFNFIPVPPLDGSHVLESLLPYQMAEAYAQIRPFGVILLLALLWFGVFRWILLPVVGLVLHLLFL